LGGFSFLRRLLAHLIILYYNKIYLSDLTHYII
jgi:hypothetical protein